MWILIMVCYVEQNLRSVKIQTHVLFLFFEVCTNKHDKNTSVWLISRKKKIWSLFFPLWGNE